MCLLCIGGCPAEDHISVNTDQELCCRYHENDCLGEYVGDISNFLACNGKHVCKNIPVIRDRINSSCISGLYPAYTTYIIFKYYCVPRK